MSHTPCSPLFILHTSTNTPESHKHLLLPPKSQTTHSSIDLQPTPPQTSRAFLWGSQGCACLLSDTPHVSPRHCALALCAPLGPRLREELRCRLLGGYASTCQEAGTTLGGWRKHTRCGEVLPSPWHPVPTPHQASPLPCPCPSGCSWPPFPLSKPKVWAMARAMAQREGVCWQVTHPGPIPGIP